MASNPTANVTTLSDLLREIVEHAETQTPEQKLRLRAALLEFSWKGNTKPSDERTIHW